MIAGRSRRLIVAVAVCSLSTLAACGSDDGAQSAALDALDRATEAAGLESEMAGLVTELSAGTLAKAETTELEEALGDLDARADDLIAAADTGETFDDEIISSAEQTQAAGTNLASAIAAPATLDAATESAVQNLEGSNQSLTSATELIGAELEGDDGELSTGDADALAATVAEVEASGQAVQDAAGSASDTESAAAPEAAANQTAPGGEENCGSASAGAPEIFSTGIPCNEAKRAFNEGAAIHDSPPGYTCTTTADGSTCTSSEGKMRWTFN